MPVFITVDPERDKPAVLKKYLAAFGPRFVGLTGTPQQIAQVEKEFRVYAKKQPLAGGNYGMDHSSVIYLMGPDGKLVSFYDEAISPEDLAKDLKKKTLELSAAADHSARRPRSGCSASGRRWSWRRRRPAPA